MRPLLALVCLLLMVEGANAQRSIIPAAGQTFYVSPAGSDSNDGLTTSTPWQHRQFAWNYVQGNVDLAGHVVTVQLLDGNYNDSFVASGPLVGQFFASYLMFQGNCTTPSNVVIAYAGPAWNADDQAMFGIKCMQLTTTLNGGVIVGSQHSGTLIVTNGGLILSGGSQTFSNFYAQLGGQIVHSGDETYIGGGSSGWQVVSGGQQIVLNTQNLYFSGTPNFTYGFANASDPGSYISAASAITHGTATGENFVVNDEAKIFTGGHCGDFTILPGSTLGSPSDGGICR